MAQVNNTSIGYICGSFVMTWIYQEHYILLGEAGRTLDNNYRHDGSIASVVLGVATMAIISANIFVTVFEPSIQLIRNIDATYLILLSLQFLGILSCICFPLVCRCLHLNTKSHENRGKIGVRLVFLFTFAVAGIVHAGIHLSCNVSCVLYKPEDILCKLEMTKNALRIVHYPLQVWFFSQLMKIKLFPSIIVHYILICQLVKFFAFWNFYLLEGLSSNTRPSHNETNCGTSTELQRTVDLCDSYLSPAVIAFCLMTVLLIASVWPKFTRTVQQKNSLAYDERKSLLIKPGKFQTSVKHNNEETPLLTNKQQYVLHERTTKSPVRSFIAGVMTNAPLLVSYCIQRSGTFGDINNIVHVIALSSKCVLLFCTFVGYFLLPKQCEAINTRVKIVTFSYFIFLFGLWGFILFETLVFFWCANGGSTLETTLVSIHTVLSTITAVQLAIYVLQMKFYKRNGGSLPWVSIENNCLYLAGLIFIYWIIDAFVVSHKLWAMKQDEEVMFPYLYTTATVVFPFAIFFRFQFILHLYELYKELRLDM